MILSEFIIRLESNPVCYFGDLTVAICETTGIIGDAGDSNRPAREDFQMSGFDLEHSGLIWFSPKLNPTDQEMQS